MPHSNYVCEDFDADINFLIHNFFGQFPGCQIMLLAPFFLENCWMLDKCNYKKKMCKL